MSQPTAVADVLDAAERLDDDAQAELVTVSSRRLAERRRERVIADVAEARCEAGLALRITICASCSSTRPMRERRG